MTTYEPSPYVSVGRPPCIACGAAHRLHTGPRLSCPTRYRPPDLPAAIAALWTARDPVARFTARGDIQRLLDHRPDDGCEACVALR